MPSPEGSSSAVTLRHPWQIAFVLAIVVGTAILLWKVVAVLLLAFAGVLGAVLLCTCADFLARWTKCNRRVGVTVMLIILVSGATALGWTIAPALAAQWDDLREQLNQSITQLDRWINRHSETLPVDDVEEIGDHISAEEMWARAGGVFSTTIGALSAITIVAFIAIFLAYDADRYLSGVLRLVPLAKRQRASEVMAAIGLTLSRWLVAQLISMTFLALSTWLALSLLGVPLALVLAVLTGVMTFVPYLGPLLAAIPIILVAFVEGPMFAVYTGLIYFVIQNIESNVLMPLVYQHTVRLPPAVTLTAQVLLGALMGLPGFILATPLAAAVLVAVRMVYVQDKLGDNLEEPVQELAAFCDPPKPP